MFITHLVIALFTLIRFFMLSTKEPRNLGNKALVTRNSEIAGIR